MGGDAAELFDPVTVLFTGGRRAEGIFDDRAVPLVRQGGDAQFTVGPVFIVAGGGPGGADIGISVRICVGPAVGREVRGGGPVSPHPSPAALFPAIQIHPGQTGAALTHRASQIDHGGTRGRLTRRHKQRGLRRSVIGQPTACFIGRLPRGIPVRIHGKFITGLDFPAHQTAHLIGSRRHKLRRNPVNAVPGCIQIPAQVIGAIPPGHVVPCREGGFRNQIAHPFPGAVLDHQGDKSRPVQLEGHGDGRGQICRSQLTWRGLQGGVPEGLQGHQFSQPYPFSLPGAALQMGMPCFRGRRGHLQAQRAGGDGLTEAEQIGPKRQRIAVLQLCNVAQTLPVAVRRIARMPVRRPGVGLDFPSGKPRPDHIQRLQTHRGGPCEHYPLRILRRHRRQPRGSRCLAAQIVPLGKGIATAVIQQAGFWQVGGGAGQRLWRQVIPALPRNESALQMPGVSLIRRLGGMRKTQRARRRPRRQHPHRQLPGSDFLLRDFTVFHPCGLHPVPVVFQSARINRLRPEHAQAAAPADQDTAGKNRGFKSNPQMPHPGFVGIAELAAGMPRPGGVRPERPPGFFRLVRTGNRNFPPVHPLRKRRRIQIFRLDRGLHHRLAGYQQRLAEAGTDREKRKTGSRQQQTEGKELHGRRLKWPQRRTPFLF